MNNIEASEENFKSPSTYGNNAYEEYTKKEKKKNKTDSEKAQMPSQGVRCVLRSLKFFIVISYIRA